MGADVASAQAERTPDSRPRPPEEKPEGTAAAPDAPGGLGARQVQAKAAETTPVGAADAPAERAADAAAERVMRLTENAPAASPAAPAPATPTPAAPAPAMPGPVAAPADGAAPVRRATDPVAEQRLPAPATSAPSTPGGSGPAGGGPDSTTPAGVAGPSPTAAASTTPTTAASTRPPPAAETGAPAPDPEPPAPEGEAPARETPQVSAQVQEYLDASRGKGSPLPEALRTTFETAFHRPLDDVRLHDEGGADDAARSIDALAFTRGSDVYFRSGAYDPSSSEGKRLLAHELAHVVQQRPGINREVVRRKAAGGSAGGLGSAVIRRKDGAKGGKAKPTKTSARLPDDLEGDAKNAYKGPAGEIKADNPAAPTMVLDVLRVPAFKLQDHKPGVAWTPAAKTDDAYRKIWRDAAGPQLAKGVPARAAAIPVGPEPYYFQRTSKILVYGTAADVGNALAVPPWNREGKVSEKTFQIDHKQEEQLDGPAAAVSNLRLLHPSLNTGAGAAIKNSITADVNAFLAGARTVLAKTPDVSALRAGKRLTFKTVTSEPPPTVKNPSAVWTAALNKANSWDLGDVKGPEALAPLEAMTPANVDRIKGSQNKLSIATRRGGGRSGTQPVPASGGKMAPGNPFLPGAFRVAGGAYTATQAPPVPGTKVGSLSVKFFPDDEGKTAGKKRRPKSFTEPFDIIGASGIEYGGVIDVSDMRTFGKTGEHLEFPGFSPLDLLAGDFDFDRGLVAKARIPKPSLRLLENVELAVVLDGDDVGVEATISAGQLSLPGPLKVTDGQLALKVTTGGISVDGQVNLEIENLATGYLRGRRAPGDDFEIEAGLEFDKKLFDRFEVKGSYSPKGWSIEGDVGVGPDKVKGIKKASAHVKVTDDSVTADGEFETTLKGIEKGTLGFVYDPAKGMAISGEILLGKGIPGIKGGKLAATVAERPDGWSVAGAVTAEPDVPGLTGTITGSYDDGAFDVEANLGYERGQAKGSLQVGLTNRSLDKEGKPTGPIAKDGSLTAYGGGTVTLTITPWLQGTVGLRLTPTGEVEVSGKVALPSQFTVFDEKKVERKVLSIGIDIPIVGVAVAGQRIGVFATIKGGLSISAGFGPGQLRDVSLEVTYNPSRPDDTTVKGTGSFVVPAHAGLRLQVDGGIGVGIPVVSATAGVSIYGEVGLAGEASAAATLQWTPRSGIVLDARGEIFVEPKFRFGIDAFVDVTADLWITEIELYHRTWKLAAFEYGSNLRFGLAFPLHYESGKPFDLSFDQIQWTYPQIDPGDLLSGLMKQLVG